MSLIKQFKEENPRYKDIPDEDLSKAIHSTYYSSVPYEDFAKAFGLPSADTSILGYAKEIGKAVPRGFIGGFLSAGEGLAELADAGTNAIGLEGLIDSGSENALVYAARQGQEALDSALGVDEAYKDAWAVKFGEGVGSFATFLVPGGAAKIMGYAAKAAPKGATMGQKAAQFAKEVAPVAPLAVGVGAGEQAQRIEQARQSGIDVSQGQEDAAILAGSIIGISELLPVERLLRRIPAGVPDEIKDDIFAKLKSAAVSGTIEGVQEVSAGIAQDLVEKGLYNPNAEVGESFWDELTVGGAVGALADLAVSYAAGRRNRLSDEASVEREKQLRELQERARVSFLTRLNAKQMTAENNAIIAQQLQEAIAAETDPNVRAGLQREFEIYSQYARTGESVDAPKPNTASQIPPPEPVDDPYEFGRQYARLIADTMGESFPASGSFTIEQSEITDEEGNARPVFSVVDGDGNQYGAQLDNSEQAISLAGSLNEEVFNAGVSGEILNILENSPEAYDPETADTLFTYGWRILNPKYSGITFMDVNRAAGTTADKGYLEPLSFTDIQSGTKKRDGSVDIELPDGRVVNTKGLTAAQRINQKRVERGLPETRVFSVQEVRDELGENFENVQISGVQPAPAGMSAKAAITDLLAQKNIDTKLESKEFSTLVNLLTGRNNFKDLTKGESALLFQRLSALPRFDKPTKLPDFTPKPYTREQFKLASQFLQDANANRAKPTDQDIAAAAGISEADPRLKEKVSALKTDLARQGVRVEQKPLLALPAPSGDSINDLRDRLAAVLKGYGLEDIGLRLNQTLTLSTGDLAGEGTEAAFDINTREIFLAVDRVDPDGTLTPEQRLNALSDILGHEIIHAARMLDLWTADEWSTLEKAVANLKKADGRTYLETAIEAYSDQPVSIQVEEAIADLARDYNKNKRVVGGRPRSMIERMFQFFSRLRNALNGTGFRTYEDVFNALSSGEVGARQRGEIRSLRATEEAMGAEVPERLRPLFGGARPAPRGRTAPPAARTQPSQPAATQPTTGQDFFEGDLEGVEIRESRRKTSISPNVISIMSDKETPPKSLKGKTQVAKYLQNRALDALRGRTRDLANEADRDAIAEDLVEEAIYEMEVQKNALEWYDSTIERTIEMMALRHPEIKSDPDSRTAFLISLAVTSQNIAVPDNLKYSEEVYDYFKRNGRFPEKGFGSKSPSIKRNFEKANMLIDELGSMKAFTAFLQSEFTVGELNPILKQHLGKKGKVGGELVGAKVYGSAVFGPKIGNGFYTNLRGNFSPVTIDMWFMRTIGRLTGKLMEFDKNKFSKQLNRLAEATGMQGASTDDLIAKALELKKKHEKDFKQFRSEYDSGVRSKTEATNAAITIVKSLNATRDAPSTGTEREQLRDIVNRAVSKMRDRTGQDIPPAAFQALIWYPEQDLYKKLGVKLKHVRQDYANSTKEFLRKQGIDERELKRAEDRVRSRRQRGARRIRQGAARDVEASIAPASQRLGKSIQEKKSPRIRESRQRSELTGDGRGRVQGRSIAPLEGSPNVEGGGPIPEIVSAAEQYAAANGIPYQRQKTYVEIDESRARRIADAYDAMLNRPNDPIVAAAYQDLIRQTKAQYDALIDSGYEFTFFDSNSDPYGGNPWNAMRDLRYNKRMAVYGTYDGYGTEGITDSAIENNPMLEDSGLRWPDQDGNMRLVTFNDLFRAVHDAFGHGIEGAGFRARGEENAWQAHARLFKGPALHALTTETRGQNSWLNFGPYGKSNQTAKLEDTVFAENKIGLMPSWTWTDGLDLEPVSTQEAPAIRESRIPRPALEQAKREAVRQAEQYPPGAVPYLNANASPEALHAALNKDSIAPLDPEIRARYSRRNEPDYSNEEREILDRMTSPKLPDETPGETFLAATSLPEIRNLIDKFRKEVFFNYSRLEFYNKYDKRLAGNLADVSSLAAAEFADRAKAILAEAIVTGVVVYENGITKVKDFVHKGRKYQGLLGVMAPVLGSRYGNLERLAQSYAIARRGARLTAEGKMAPGKPEDLAKLERIIDQYTDENGNSIIREWYDAWQAYNENTIKFMRDTGMVDEQTAELWRQTSDYIPYYKLNDKGDAKHPRVFGGMTSTTMLKSVGKSESAIDTSLVESVLMNLDAAITMGMKNVAQQRIVRDMITIGQAEMVKTGQEPKNNNIVTFKVRGKKVSAAIYDDLVFESMQAVPDLPVSGFVESIISAPSQVLRELIIREPSYMMANLMRDTASVAITSGSNFIPVVDTVKGLVSGLDELSRYGIVSGYDFNKDPKNAVKFMSDEAIKRGIRMPTEYSGRMSKMLRSRYMKPMMLAWDALGSASTRAEAATRKAVYDDVLKRIDNEAEAAYQAMSIINYGRRGRNPYLKLLTAAVPFLNARLQGLDVLFRAATGTYSARSDFNRKRNILNFVTRSMLMVGLTALYWNMVSDDEEYENQSEENKDNYYFLPVKRGNLEQGVKGYAVKIPIPFEVGVLFKVIPERILEYTHGEIDKRSLQQSLFRAGTSTLGINVIPQVFKPIVEVYANYDFFTGRQVVPSFMEMNLEPRYQSRFSTNELAVMIGEKLNISPMKLEHLMEGYLGSLGVYTLDVVDALLREGDREYPARRLYEYPPLRRFITTNMQPGMQNQFYDMSDKIMEATGSINQLIKDGRVDELQAHLIRKESLIQFKDINNDIRKMLQNYRQSKQAILKSDMDPETKREMIDELDRNIALSLRVVPELRKKAFGSSEQ